MKRTSKKLSKKKTLKKFSLRESDEVSINVSALKTAKALIDVPLKGDPFPKVEKQVKKELNTASLVFWSISSVIIWYCIGNLFFSFVNVAGENISDFSTLSPLFTYFSPKTVVLVLILMVLSIIFYLNPKKKIFKG